MNKKKLAVISGVVLALVGFGFIYHKAHTNSPDDIKDYTGKYILNPNYYKFKEVEWTDLKSVYPTKLAYDPAWFKLPPEKYIPKEQPIPKEISNISDPIVRRQAYFNFLCKTEYAAYMTNDIKGKRLETHNPDTEGTLDLTAYNFFQKTKNNQLNYDGSSNPFIVPIYFYSYETLYEGDTYDFFYWKINDKPNGNWGKEDKFKEVMTADGTIYTLKYDSSNKTMLPIFKTVHSEARYYKLEKFSDRDDLKNLGISSHETIIYDRKEKKLAFYLKQFNIGAFLPWTAEGKISNFSWIKQEGCNFKPKYIDKF